MKFQKIVFNEKTALHIAVQNNNKKIIQLLLGFNGIDLNGRDGIIYFFIKMMIIINNL